MIASTDSAPISPGASMSGNSGASKEDWQWQTWEGQLYLTCQLLSSWQHGFFSRQCWPQLPGQLTQALAPADVYRVKQVHGNGVLEAAELQAVDPSREPESEFDHGDGLVSSGPGQALWVCSADCTPALIGDIRTGQVSAVHAGWRGTAARILPVAIAKLLAQGSQLQDLRVALGPAIAGEVYQVDEAVAMKAGRSLLALGGEKAETEIQLNLSPWPSEVGAEQAVAKLTDVEIVQRLAALKNSPLLPDPEPGKVKLHVRQVSVLQLLELGLETEQISIAPHCTHQDSEHFFSYRRTGEKKVQWSGIVSQ